jgi:hypothetical protein
MNILGDDYQRRVFIIPGNHDVDRTKAKAVRRYDMLHEIPTFLDPTSEGRQERHTLLERFQAFSQYPWYLEDSEWVSSVEGFLARRLNVGSLDVGVLCINTAWFCGGANDQNNLVAGLEMVEAGLSRLTGCRPIIVLGHHPFDWLEASNSKRIRALLSKMEAIYLHGHLHKSVHSSQSLDPHPLISLQAGCAFYARNDEEWVNRLLWAGYDATLGDIFIRPRKWVQDRHEWALDADAFADSFRAFGKDVWTIPTRHKISPTTKTERSSAEPAAPDGWAYLDEHFFQERHRPVSDERIVKYFDGSAPTWEDILSERIPVRKIVEELTETILQGTKLGRSQVTLLLGAGGEGKSTAFLQTLHTLVHDHQMNIVWRSNPDRGLPTTFVNSIAGRNAIWLFASDEADSLAADTYSALKAINGKSNVHFFLTSRDTDWIEAGGNNFSWGHVCNHAERGLKGLDEDDAHAIVAAWTRLGKPGLGNLSELAFEEAVQRLLDAARAEATASDGAFLGAMLRVRLGVALKDHVFRLMTRLEKREIAGHPGKTLLDAFAYIAIPHGLNLLFLSKSVLARAIGVEETKVRRRILLPLGEEAAASAVGPFILTRHRAIAEAATEILGKNFGWDSEDVLVELVIAAIRAGLEAELVPNLKEWRFLSTRFFEQGNQELGVKLAAAAASTDSRNSFLAVKLAQLYREAGQPEHSVEVFRNSIQKAKGNRGFFTEWATCEASVGNAAVAIWLLAVSVADETEMRPPDNRDVSYALVGFAARFAALFDRYSNEVFIRASAASVRLSNNLGTLQGSGSDILNSARERLEQLGFKEELAVEQALSALDEGIRSAHKQTEIEMPSIIIAPGRLHFEYMKELLLRNEHRLHALDQNRNPA